MEEYFWLDKNFTWKENFDLLFQIAASWPFKQNISSICLNLFPLFYSERMNQITEKILVLFKRKSFI